MRIVIVRHGETNENREGIMQGQSFGTLSQKGKGQARKLAGRLKEERFDLVFSSDLERTRQTAKEIMTFHENEVIFSPLLREMHMGEFHGRPISAYRSARDSSGISEADFRPNGGENYHDVRKRAAEFVAGLEEHEGRILVIAHEDLNRALIAELAGLSTDQAMKIKQDNTCVNVLERNGHGTSIRMINDTSHLN